MRKITWLNRRMLATLGAAAGVLVLMGSAGLVDAYAEPTPSPTPGATTSPSSPVSGTATPTATQTATPTGEPTPTPQATPTAEPTPTATRAATPSARPTLRAGTAQDAGRQARLRRDLPPVQEPARVGDLAEDLADDRFTVEVLSECFSGDHSVTVTLTLNVDEAVTLDYRLTNEILVDRTGSVTISPSPGVATLVFDADVASPGGLVDGPYHFDLFEPGSDEPIAVQNFDILRCVGVLTDCQRVRFGYDGYDGRLPVTLVYGEGLLEDADPDTAISVTLEPGEERTIRTDWETLYWFAGTSREGSGGNSAIELAGEEPGLTIEQDCDPAPLTQTGARCTPPGGPTVLATTIERRDGDFYRYEVRDTDGDVVASRSVPAGPLAQATWLDELPGPGTYRFNYYLNGSQQATETRVFRALRCLVVVESCRQFTLTNPASNPPVRVEYFLLNEDPSGEFVLPPGGSEVISWENLNEQFDLRWFARAADGASAGSGTEPGIPVDCTPSPQPSPTATSPAPQPGPGGDDDGLADTGSPVGAVGGLVLGLLLVTAGAALLGLRRGH